MGSLVINSGGMGALSLPPGPSLLSPAWQTACGTSYPGYLFDLDCWGHSYDEWVKAFYGAAGSVPIATPAAPGVPTSALTDPNAVLGDTSGDVGQQISNQQISQTQAANQSAFASSALSNMSPLCNFFACDAGGNFDPTDMSNWAWIAAGVAALYLLGKLL